MATWDYYLCKSSDLTAIGLLTQARGRTLSLTLNKPGNATFNLPLDDDLAYEVQPLTTCVKVVRDGVTMWSGPVWPFSVDAASQRIAVTAVGWFQLMNARMLREKKSYTAQDAGAIASDLFAYANSISPLLLSVGVVQASQPRSITFEKHTKIGDAIAQLAEIEGGFDFVVNPQTRKVDIYAIRRTLRPDVIFAYGVPPFNLQNLQQTVDPSTMANRVTVNGQRQPALAEDTAAQATYGLFEDFITLSDVADNGVLLAYAGAEVLLRSAPRVTYSALPFSFTEGGSVPEYGVEWELGDVVYLSADVGRLQVNKQAQRVFGVDFAIDDNGNEKITALHTAPS